MSTTESDYLTVAIWRDFLFHSIMKCYLRVRCHILMRKREMPNESGLYCYQNPIPYTKWLSLFTHILGILCTFLYMYLEFQPQVWIICFLQKLLHSESKHIFPTIKKNQVAYFERFHLLKNSLKKNSVKYKILLNLNLFELLQSVHLHQRLSTHLLFCCCLICKPM